MSKQNKRDLIGEAAENLILAVEGYNTVDHFRQGLQETPGRFVKAVEHWFSGYKLDPAYLFKTFEDGAENYDEMVLLNDIPVYSHCEHHIAPIFGFASVAYIPEKRIIGLSKIPRLVEIFARRLQVQERLTTQIAETINEHLKPKGVGVILRCRHMCMESRGISQTGVITTTSKLIGVFKEPTVRSEFLNLSGASK